MAKEGIPFIVLFLTPAALLIGLGMWLGAALCVALAAFMAFFFRDPDRTSPADDRLVVSPADGKVLLAASLQDGASSQVSIFLSPLDVHINRSPIAGEVTGVVYKRGAFHVASRDIASVENEQNILTLSGPHCTVVMRQVAGALARRLVLWKRQGDKVSIGERIGLMKFGSRVDLIIPAEVELLVRRGDRVIGGVTVIGRIADVRRTENNV
jgi:phosphatidylserine decarboxylase